LAEDLVLGEDVDLCEDFGGVYLWVNQLGAEGKGEEVSNVLQLGVYATVLVEFPDLCEVATLIWDERFQAEGLEAPGLADEGVNLVDPGKRGGFLPKGGGDSSYGL
jgi:hypothetical protein